MKNMVWRLREECGGFETWGAGEGVEMNRGVNRVNRLTGGPQNI